jgi:hypothetical protein
MGRAGFNEYFALLIAALTLTVVLVASFMCIQLYHLRKPGNTVSTGGARREGFPGGGRYSPRCSSEWLGLRRGGCAGATAGSMPAIETPGAGVGDGLCCGRLGVPP